MDRALKNQTVTPVKPVLLSPLVDYLTGFGQVSALTMLQHLFSSYRATDTIDLEENAVKTISPYNSSEPPARLIEQLEKWERIRESRRPENIQSHDDVKRNHPSGANRDFKRQHQRVETTICRPQDVVDIQLFFPPSALRAEKSSNNRGQCKTSTVHHLSLQNSTMS